MAVQHTTDAGDICSDVMSTSPPADEDAVVESTQTLSMNDDASTYMTYPGTNLDSYPVTSKSSCLVPSSTDLSPGDTLSSWSYTSSPAPVKSSVNKVTSSVDEDSAYMTHPASIPSTPSSVSVSPVSWGQDWRDRRDDDDDGGGDGQYRPQTQEKVKRKSWAAGQGSERVSHYYHQYHLHQSESWDDITQQTTSTASDDAQEFVVPADTPRVMSLFASARRRLGKRRDVSVTSCSATTNSNNNNNNNNCTTTTDSGEYGLHRAPSSLFYLQYSDDEDDDDDDDSDVFTEHRRKMQRYLDLPSSRKISAAAYLPRQLPSPSRSPSDETHHHHQQQQQQQQEEVAKRRRRLPPQHLAVTTIDEILRRQDSSLQQFYKDTMRQVCHAVSLFVTLCQWHY